MTPTTGTVAEAGAGVVAVASDKPAPIDVEMSRKSDQTAEKSAGDEDGESHSKKPEVNTEFTPSEGLTTTGVQERMDGSDNSVPTRTVLALFSGIG